MYIKLLLVMICNYTARQIFGEASDDLKQTSFPLRDVSAVHCGSQPLSGHRKHGKCSWGSVLNYLQIIAYKGAA